jgi:hypothetical protein
MIIFRFWLKSNIKIMPFDVPSTTEAETAMHVGEPKFLLPASENACPFSLLSFVHRTTSHGGEGVSVSPGSSRKLLLRDTLRLCPVRNAGDSDRGERGLGDAIRDWKRRSKGLNEGVGLFNPGREATEGSTLLLGDETTEPCKHDMLDPNSRKSHYRPPAKTECRPVRKEGSQLGSLPSLVSHP